MFLPNPTNIRRSNLVGIDDMFVIMQSLDNLGPNERKANNIPQNIGQTMKHAGHNGVKTLMKSYQNRHTKWIYFLNSFF